MKARLVERHVVAHYGTIGHGGDNVQWSQDVEDSYWRDLDDWCTFFREGGSWLFTQPRFAEGRILELEDGTHIPLAMLGGRVS